MTGARDPARSVNEALPKESAPSEDAIDGMTLDGIYPPAMTDRNFFLRP
jgi:hypothetical protein